MTHVKPQQTDIAIGNCIRQIPLSVLFTRHPNPELMIVCHLRSVCFTFAIKAININRQFTDRIRSMGEGYVFTGVCHSVYREGRGV